MPIEVMTSKFCAECGNVLTRGIPLDDDVERMCCAVCGYVHYDSPKILVACILYHRNRLLWMRRALGPFAGRWGFPGGFVEHGETVQEAACREVREEVRLVLDPSLLGIYGVLSIPDINEVYVSLIAPLPSMQFGPTREAQEVQLLSQVEVASYDRAFSPATDNLIRDLYGRLHAGPFSSGPAMLMQVRGKRI